MNKEILIIKVLEFNNHSKNRRDMIANFKKYRTLENYNALKFSTMDCNYYDVFTFETINWICQNMVDGEYLCENESHIFSICFQNINCIKQAKKRDKTCHELKQVK